MIIHGHNQSDFSENLQRCHDYIQALEEERRKIQVFERELPLCLELVTQAIETYKQQLSGAKTECNLHGQSEYSEQTTSDVPVFEEFIPIKTGSFDSDEEEQEPKKPKNETTVCNEDGKNCNYKNSKKSDWLRSVQLWNQTPDPPSNEDSPRILAVSEVKGNGGAGAFHPFKKEKNSIVNDITATTLAKGPRAPPPSTSSSAETGGSGGGNKKEEKENQSQRKARRCWSPELHRRFLQALEQLGGSHVATPKQIRELMKVDGLTHDEVKSHLQKYRLHTRRPSPSTHNNARTPQFVVVGGIWVPPEYAAVATATASPEAPSVETSKKFYAPIAAPSPRFQESRSSPKERQQIKPSSESDDSKGAIQSCSPATSSTDTTTVSPVC